MEKPLHPHGCKKCRFLGSHNAADLYWCDDTSRAGKPERGSLGLDGMSHKIHYPGDAPGEPKLFFRIAADQLYEGVIAHMSDFVGPDHPHADTIQACVRLALAAGLIDKPAADRCLRHCTTKGA